MRVTIFIGELLLQTLHCTCLHWLVLSTLQMRDNQLLVIPSLRSSNITTRELKSYSCFLTVLGRFPFLCAFYSASKFWSSTYRNCFQSWSSKSKNFLQVKISLMAKILPSYPCSNTSISLDLPQSNGDEGTILPYFHHCLKFHCIVLYFISTFIQYRMSIYWLMCNTISGLVLSCLTTSQVAFLMKVS